MRDTFCRTPLESFGGSLNFCEGDRAVLKPFQLYDRYLPPKLSRSVDGTESSRAAVCVAGFLPPSLIMADDPLPRKPDSSTSPKSLGAPATTCGAPRNPNDVPPSELHRDIRNALGRKPSGLRRARHDRWAWAAFGPDEDEKRLEAPRALQLSSTGHLESGSFDH